MKKSKKAAIALALSALTVVASGCSGDSAPDETVNQRVWNCDQVQITYNTLGPDSTDPDAILYCMSIGELVP